MCGVCVCVCCVWSRFAGENPIRVVWRGLGCAGPPLRRTPPPDRPKFRSFFFPTPTTIFILSSLSLGSFRGILVVFFEGRDPQMCTFGVLGLSCPEKTLREREREREKKNENGSGEGKKKRDFFGPPIFGAPPFGAATFGVCVGVGVSVGVCVCVGVGVCWCVCVLVCVCCWCECWCVCVGWCWCVFVFVCDGVWLESVF